MKLVVHEKGVPRRGTPFNVMHMQVIENVYENHVYASPNINAIIWILFVHKNIFHPFAKGLEFQ